jgi:hypothetical protein
MSLEKVLKVEIAYALLTGYFADVHFVRYLFLFVISYLEI